MTDEEIAELRRLDREAFPRPYVRGKDESWIDGGLELKQREIWVGTLPAVSPVSLNFNGPEHVLDATWDLLVAARNAMPSLLDEVERSRTLLRRIEWSARVGQDSDSACPECEEWEPGPHAADCELAALIGAARLGR